MLYARYVAYDPSGNQLYGVKELTEPEIRQLTDMGFTFHPYREQEWSPLLTLTELMGMTHAQREFLSVHSGGNPVTRKLTAAAILAKWTCPDDIMDANGFPRHVPTATVNLTPACGHATGQHADRCF